MRFSRAPIPRPRHALYEPQPYRAAVQPRTQGSYRRLRHCHTEAAFAAWIADYG